jgi:EAL domain-containing protein (putative c-di-GMP-specific phosphodiesterase class I)
MLVTLVSGILITLLVFAAVRRIEHGKESAEFRLQANQRFFAIKEGLRDAQGGLRRINQLFSVIGTIDREHFNTFTRPLLERYPYIQAITFNRAVSAAERPAYEAVMRRTYPDFVISEPANGKLMEARPRATYYAIHYIEPAKGNERAIGLDAALFGKSATEQERQIGDVRIARANRLVRIMEGEDSQGGFMLKMSVFSPVAHIKDLERGRYAILGDTTAIFKCGNLIGQILQAKGFAKLPGMDIRMEIGERLGEAPLVAVQASDTYTGWLSYRTPQRMAKTFEFARQPVHLLATYRPPPAINHGSFYFLLTGLLCSFAAAAYVHRRQFAISGARKQGGDTGRFYAPAMNEQALAHTRLESDLRNAVEREEFVLHYQPQVNVSSGRVVGVEALIRWNHPVRGMIPPASFIGLAEETGLIVPIGAWALRTACTQAKAWQQAGLGQLRVAVNVSARQFASPGFVDSITNVLNETGLAPQCLEIELTESLVMTDVEQAIGIMKDIKGLDVKLAIDDFGTGYSGLSYLKRFPIDVLKIDQSFVRDITKNPDDAAIVVSIISLARNLRLDVIAEGVETNAQLAHLRRHGCHEMQGFLFSKPVPEQALTELLRAGKGLSALNQLATG